MLNIQKISTGMIVCLYISFLVMDFNRMQHTMFLKYAVIWLCFFISICSLKQPHRAGDARLLCCGLGFTVLADTILLFRPQRSAMGVAVFCLAHLCYVRRYRKSAVRGYALLAAGTYLAAVLLHFTHQALVLPVVSVLYTCLIISVTIFCFKHEAPRPNRLLMRGGMLLFLLCDIHVVLFNIGAGNALQSVARVAMWMFYAPSQLMLSLSGLGFKKKEEKG